jgi:hypothetical protein
MSAQLAYSINQGKAYAGLIYALAPHNIVSRSVEPAAGIAFGVAVTRGTDVDNQTTFAASASFIGITVRSLENEGVANTGAINWAQNQTAAIMRAGYIWAICPTGCVPGNPVNYVDGTGVLDSGAAGVGETQLDGATWETTAAAGELGVIRLETTAVTAGS